MENGFSLKKCGLACCFCAALAICGASTSAFSRTKILKPLEHVPGELVIKLRDGVAQAQAAVISALQKRLGQNAVVDLKPFVTDRSLSVVRLSRDGDLGAAITALRSEPAVEYSEPNMIYRSFDDGDPLRVVESGDPLRVVGSGDPLRIARDDGRPPGLARDGGSAPGLPNDPEFGKLWGLHNTGHADHDGQVGRPGADIDIVPLWQEGFHGDRKVLVAVIDTGIDWTHPDLAANLYTNPGEIPGNGIDDDHNGFIDDVHGWNFVNHTNDSRDDHKHGSHCSGTIGGVGDNGIGVAGVNWQVSLMPVKFLDNGGSGTLEHAVEAIQYATLMGANVMSNSWGGGGFTQSLKDAIHAARAKGILFVAAAGNDSSDNDGTPTYPAAYDEDNIVAVAATDNKDALASFSNWGVKTVHVAAPGVNIYSTVLGGNYDYLSGTSMATPHVSGIAALLLSANPAWTYADIKNRLIQTSDPVPGLRRKVAARGRVNAYNAMHGIIPPNPDPDPSLWKDVAKTVESDHPYQNNEDNKVTISQPGVKYIRVHFEKVEVEANYDKVWIEAPSGDIVDELTGSLADVTSEYVKGDTLVVHFKSDESNTGWGYKVDKIQIIN